MQQPFNTLTTVEQDGSIMNTTTAKKTKNKWNYRLWMNLDVVLLCVLIIGVWSLLSMPIIFYRLPGSQISSNTSTNRNGPSGDSVCSAPLKYATTNGVCVTEFANILSSSNCPLGPEGNVLVVRNEEVIATQLITELTSSGASIECRRKAIPFVCQHLFGLCSGSGVSIQTTSSQCEEIRDTTCQKVWVDIERLMDLQDCAMFPAEASSCPPLNHSHSTNETVLENHSSFLNRTTVAVLECSEGFYQENASSVCTPSCYTWTQYSKGLSLFIDVISFATALIGFVAAAAVIVISCLVYKRMLTFPSIFIVYMMLDTLALRFIIMVGFIDRSSLFCSSRSLFESIQEVTPFCVITGVLSSYAHIQLAMWWIFHIAVLFWRVVFPFHAQSYGNIKYIHLTCVIVGLLLPLVPTITTMAEFAVDVQKQNKDFFTGGLGFGLISFPPIMCSTRNMDVVFYSSALTLDIIVASGCTMLLIVVWSLHRLHKRKREQGNVKFIFGTGEKKLLIILCFFLGLTLLYITTLTLYARNASEVMDSFQRNILCEQGGHNPRNPCNHSEIQALSYPSMDILVNVLATSFPFLNLLYVVNIQELKKLWRKWFEKHQSTANSII